MRKWIFGGLALLLGAVAIAFIWARVRLKPMLRERLITAIREHYRREIEVKDIEISALTGFGATIHGLVLHQKDREAGLPPMALVERVRVSATLRGILSEPLQIERVVLEGLKINVPPKRPKSPDSPEPDKPQTERRYPPRFVINEVLADGTFLQILPKKEGKEPLTFDITKLTLHSAGTTQSMQFRATLTNPKPPGDIQSTGEFGPWDSDEPGLTPVSGSYTFANADLSDFKGLAGILSSEGKYQGMLERIEVDGATDTPDFTLKVSGHPVHSENTVSCHCGWHRWRYVSAAGQCPVQAILNCGAWRGVREAGAERQNGFSGCHRLRRSRRGHALAGRQGQATGDGGRDHIQNQIRVASGG